MPTDNALPGVNYGSYKRSEKVKKDAAEIVLLLGMTRLRHWPRLVAFLAARALKNAGLVSKDPVFTLHFKRVSAHATTAYPCGLRFLTESVSDDIYNSFSTNPPVKVLFDVGANAGFISLMRCLENPVLRAVCFEPHPQTFEVLKKNIQINRLEDRVTAVHAAVGDRSGTMQFYQAEGDSMAAASTMCLMKGVPVKEYTVAVVSLDDYCRSHNVWPDAVKIDVEGFEEHVLRGAREVVERARHLVLEWHTQDLHDKCRSMLESSSARVSEHIPFRLLFSTRAEPT